LGQTEDKQAHRTGHMTATELLAEINLALQYDYTISDITKLLQKAQAFIDSQRQNK
jgi:hypothetical protein